MNQTHMQIDRRCWNVLVVAIVVNLIACALIAPFVPDDSYISFRYAEHLADGHGLRFNTTDPPVEGYSNLLWIAALAVVKAMGFHLPAAAPVLGGLFGLLSLSLLWFLFVRRRMEWHEMMAPLLLVATAGPFVIYAISGLETSFFAFLLLLTLLAYDQCRESGRMADAIGLGFVGFLAALCRPEGVVALPVLVATAVIAQRGLSDVKRVLRPWLVALAGFSLLYVLYTVWRMNYFGGLLPTPFLSKGVGAAYLTKWVQNLSRYFVVQGYQYPPIGYYFATITLLAFLGARQVKEKASVERAALVLVLVYIVIYVNFLDWMPGMRYHAGLVPLFFLPMAPLLNRVLRALGDAVWSRRQVLVVAALVLLNASILMDLRLGAKQLEEGSELCLKALAEWIDEYTPSDWRIAMSDVGAVPYYSRRYTIDIHPESLTDLHIARQGWDAEYVLDKRPEIMLLVARGVFSPRMYPEHFAMGQLPRFSALYRFIGTVRFGYVEDRCYWMFVPKSWPPLSDEAFEAFPGGVGSMRRVER